MKKEKGKKKKEKGREIFKHRRRKLQTPVECRVFRASGAGASASNMDPVLVTGLVLCLMMVVAFYGITLYNTYSADNVPAS